MVDRSACWGDDRPVRELAASFPLTEAWLWEEDSRPSEEIQPLLDPVFDHGSIVLGTDGCGRYWHLIVSGPHRGHIWNISGGARCPSERSSATPPGRRGSSGGSGTGRPAGHTYVIALVGAR
ncbi:hypothetical protein GCM10027615_64240 [Plantactinospora veratri]